MTRLFRITPQLVSYSSSYDITIEVIRVNEII